MIILEIIIIVVILSELVKFFFAIGGNLIKFLLSLLFGL